jgi:hypothetical protein
MITIDNYLDSHYIHRSNWLRAAVLGANDGIISISSLAIGVAAASSTREPIVLATVAALVAGALSMAAGEYVSVSSQTDTEKTDIEREEKELKEMPKEELIILAQIYEKRGLKKETAMQVAIELTEKDALATHIRDELGINEISQAKPIQAALASGAFFYSWWCFTFINCSVCYSQRNGILVIWFHYNFSCHFRSYISKNWWFKNKKSNFANHNMGNSSNGLICISGLYFWR